MRLRVEWVLVDGVYDESIFFKCPFQNELENVSGSKT
jgi:hypothetical protein